MEKNTIKKKNIINCPRCHQEIKTKEEQEFVEETKRCLTCEKIYNEEMIDWYYENIKNENIKNK